jgi:hypothetical protein
LKIYNHQVEYDNKKVTKDFESLFNILKAPGPHKGLQRKSFWRSQKIEAESPYFGALRQKCAQIPNYKGVFEQALISFFLFLSSLLRPCHSSTIGFLTIDRSKNFAV